MHFMRRLAVLCQAPGPELSAKLPAAVFWDPDAQIIFILHFIKSFVSAALFSANIRLRGESADCPCVQGI